MTAANAGYGYGPPAQFDPVGCGTVTPTGDFHLTRSCPCRADTSGSSRLRAKKPAAFSPFAAYPPARYAHVAPTQLATICGDFRLYKGIEHDASFKFDRSPK